MITDINILNRWTDSTLHDNNKDCDYLINSTSFLCDSMFAGDNRSFINNFRFDIDVVVLMKKQRLKYKQSYHNIC